jgi:hypothetical protein
MGGGCNMNSICEMGENTQTCINDCMSCGDVLDSTDCANDPACTWNAGMMVCEPMGGGPETSCSNGLDDDSDGQMDCADTDCAMDITCSCGDNTLNGVEVCDGPDLGIETCVTQGFTSGTLACMGTCDAFDTSGCMGGPETSCSNGLDDDSDGQMDCADTDCAMDITCSCGDSILNGVEVCDAGDLGIETCVTQGFVSGTLACMGTCDAFDTSGCSMCGNNTLEGVEVCDGIDLGIETCITQGFVSGTLACMGTCDAFDTSGCSM